MDYSGLFPDLIIYTITIGLEIAFELFNILSGPLPPTGGW